MNPNNEFFIRMILNDVHKEIQEIQKNYNNSKIEFKIGDTIFYIIQRTIVKGKIVDIEDYTKGGLLPNALVYYWIRPKSICRNFIERVRYEWLKIRHKKYVPGNIFVTNYCLAGDDFFRTEKEADIMEVLYGLEFYLQELLYLKENN